MFRFTHTAQERYTELPIPFAIDLTTQHRAVLAVKIPTLYPGDLLEATAACGITNPYADVIMVGRFITITPAPGVGQTSDQMMDDASGIRLGGGAMARNILPGTRHDYHEQNVAFKGTEIMEKRCVNFIVYAASQLTQPGWKATIDPGGYLKVKITPARYLNEWVTS